MHLVHDELIPFSTLGEPRRPWSENEATRVAEESGIGRLGEAHWQLIHTFREHFIKYGAMPPASLACTLNHLNADCVERLFHGVEQARRVAGLPAPGQELEA